MEPRRILVVLAADERDWHLTQPLVERAMSLGRHFNAVLILLHVAYEPALGFGVFASRETIDAGRLKLMAGFRTAQEALGEKIRARSDLEVQTETVWSHDHSQTILATAETRHADLILKQNDDHAFLLGLLPATDWDLVRNATMPVWFVARDAERDPANGILAAVDQNFFDEDAEQHFTLDHECFDTAKVLSDRFESPLYAVHAYPVPDSLGGYDAMLPVDGRGPEPISRAPGPGRAARTQISQQHREVVLDFIDEHGIPLDDVVIREGSVDQVLTNTARAMNAGLIVMGSTNRTWWDRVLGRVHAEPTLAKAPCDVLFIRPARDSGTGVA